MTCIIFSRNVSMLFLFIFIKLAVLNEHVYSQDKSDNWKFESEPEWSDEFNNNGELDSNKWSFEVGGDKWGNNELQYYTNGKNVVIEDGVLKIIAREEQNGKRKYTSARIVTKNNADWKYGRVEVKAKMPHGRGTWPAIWMLPAHDYYGSGVNSGEIDILEYVGYEPDKIHFSVHTKKYNSELGNAKTKEIIVNNAEDSFHIYRMDWTPYGIRGYVDGKMYFEYTNNAKGYEYWPFDKRFFLILNLAVGGDWGGLYGVDNKIFPAIMEVNYVRVFKFVR